MTGGFEKGILYTPFHPEEGRARVADAGFEVVRDRVSGNCLDVVARRR